MPRLLAYFLLFVGAVFMVRGGLAVFNAAFADRYARTSPTAFLWRKWWGESGAVVAVHRVLGPLMMLVGLTLISVVLLEGITMNNEQRASNRIDYIEIPVVDVQAAKDFYGDVFGWAFVDFGPDYASFNDGRLDGGLRKDTGGARGGPLVIFYDARLEEKAAKIRDSKGRIVKEIFEFPGGRRFHFLDPDGNEFAVWSDK